MKLSTLAFAAFGATLASTLATPAFALPDVVFVDPNTGQDTNACTAAAPCLTLNHAQTAVNDPGTIIVVSSGTLSPVTITSGLTIACPGVVCLIDSSANFNGSGTVAVTINAPNKSVSLNGVSISGFATGTTGIAVTDVTKVELKNTSISGEQNGIIFAPANGTNSHLYLMDSEVRNSSVRQIWIAPTGSNTASAEFTRSRVHHGAAGFIADATAGTGGVSVVISESTIGFANNNDVAALGNASGAGARVMIQNSTISHSSANCIWANNATAQIALSKTMVTQCTNALAQTGGGTIFTYGDNAIHFNSSDGSTPVTAGGFR